MQYIQYQMYNKNQTVGNCNTVSAESIMKTSSWTLQYSQCLMKI
jgi:hypothetical protein